MDYTQGYSLHLLSEQGRFKGFQGSLGSDRKESLNIEHGLSRKRERERERERDHQFPWPIYNAWLSLIPKSLKETFWVELFIAAFKKKDSLFLVMHRFMNI